VARCNTFEVALWAKDDPAELPIEPGMSATRDTGAVAVRVADLRRVEAGRFGQLFGDRAGAELQPKIRAGP
jgi:hypothetical protein